jgi:murein DD-endopeptidase MepM/ murein hydrolase activator NlpD
MKKINFSNSKVKKIFSGKGFYVALCLCMVTVITVGFISYKQTVNKIKNQSPSISLPKNDSSSKWDFANTNKDQNSKAVEDVNADKNEPIMVVPVNGDIIKPFSYPEPVLSETTKIWQTHNGTDIKGEIGDPVKSISNGTVKSIKDDVLLGTTVTIDHGNGIVAKYCNLGTTLTVKEGDTVSAGTVIGSIGDTAESEKALGPHLHLEIKQNNQYIDPVDLIQIGK